MPFQGKSSSEIPKGASKIVRARLKRWVRSDRGKGKKNPREGGKEKMSYGNVDEAISRPTRRAILGQLAWFGLTIGHSPFLLNVDNIGGMKMQDTPAVKIALAHIDAWSRHDWDKTRELLAPNVHAFVTTTMPNLAPSNEFTGIDNYMALKVKGAQLVEPGSVQVIGTIGDESNALTLVTFRIALGPGATMVTMARASVYLLDEHKKIKEERDSFSVLSSTP
jgi:hypothetical protein